jgi:transposase-like protein
MDKRATKEPVTSTPAWDELEEWTRGRIQEWMQQMLVDEVTEFLGRGKHQRRGVDMQGYRNGYGKPRRLTMRSGTITVRRPRVRDLDERFESRLLPLFTRRTKEVRDLLPDLYLHGLASGDFELALRGLLGDQAALSASTVVRVKERWQAEYSEWKQGRIEDEIVYLWLDGVYLKAGLEKEKAALLVAIGVKADGHKVVLAVSSGYRESTASWSGLLRELKARGMNEPRLVVGDGNLGLWSALRNVFPGAAEQRCWNHRVVNVLTHVPRQRQGEARELLTKIPYQASERQARKQKRVFQNWCVGRGYERAAELIDENWEQMVTFYQFPRDHWRHLRTTNVVESPFAALRLRTDAAKRFKKVANATAVVWKMLLVAERKFRRINSPELLPAVAAGQQYHDGLPSRGGQHHEAAA